MALTVEDGTGKADADAYVSVADFKTACAKLNYAFTDYEDVEIEAAIRLSTGWIDTQARYKGARLLTTQALEFPRTGMVDWSGYEITGLPTRVVRACIELAFKGLAEEIYQDLDRGGRISSESVGSISVTYADDAPAGKVWTYAERLLQQYIREKATEIISFGFTEPETDAQFSIGMNDYAADDLSDDV